jgi:hypothetical protein
MVTLTITAPSVSHTTHVRRAYPPGIVLPIACTARIGIVMVLCMRTRCAHSKRFRAVDRSMSGQWQSNIAAMTVQIRDFAGAGT